MTQALMSPFDQLAGPESDPLVTAAAALTAHAIDDPSGGALVIVMRPHTPRHQVLAGGGNGSLRAAVSVAASGHDRLWSEVPTTGTTSEVAVRTLPEVLRAAAEASSISSVHIGRIDTEQGVACVALWFETHAGVASLNDRETALAVLGAAAEKFSEAESRRRTTGTPTVIDLDEPTGAREFDPTDPDLDSVTGVPHAAHFSTLIASYAADEANLLIIDLDDFDTVAVEQSDSVLRTIADRLVMSTRSRDIIGRVGPHSFGVLFDSIERSEAFHVAKRLSNVIKEPIDTTALTATIALAHQSGLIDMDELRELADEAIASGKRSGNGRLVMAA